MVLFAKINMGVTHPPDPWLYQAAVVRVVTPVCFDMQIDLGFTVTREIRVHLRGAVLPDGYDISGDSDTATHKALTAVSDWFHTAATADLPTHYPLFVRTWKRSGIGDAGSGDTNPALDGRFDVDVVRRSDSDNLREHVTDRFPSMADADSNGDGFFGGDSDDDQPDPSGGDD